MHVSIYQCDYASFQRIIDIYTNEEIQVTLKRIFEDIMQDRGIDPKAQASANVVLLMDKLKTSPEFSELLRQLQMPSDKYKAIVKFADILGIPNERFSDFVQQQQNQQTHDQLNSQPNG